MTTLIADDDISSRMYLQRTLAGYGPSHSAVTGREALQAFRFARDRGRPYDLICLDILMPEMNGHEVLKEIRKLEREEGIEHFDRVKVLMTTVMGDSESILAAFQSECEGYLVKPIDVDRLHELMASFGFHRRDVVRAAG